MHGFAEHTTLGTEYAEIQQTNATLARCIQRFSRQTPPWHGAYSDSADKRHLGTAHVHLQRARPPE